MLYRACKFINQTLMPVLVLVPKRIHCAFLKIRVISQNIVSYGIFELFALQMDLVTEFVQLRSIPFKRLNHFGDKTSMENVRHVIVPIVIKRIS